MCGIAGYVLARGRHDVPLGLLRAMTDAVAHRGPDDEGYLFVDRSTGDVAEFAGAASPRAIRDTMPLVERAGAWAGHGSPDLALGHRRFAIIGPSPSGHQPLWDSQRRACLVVNGEIYNYLELRAELLSEGHEFKSDTDSEVLLLAYLAWGERCFERFNGTWALALYDFRRRELLLSRDRAGERQLYWLRRPEGIFFSSEIRALLACAGARGSAAVEEDVADDFLRHGASDLGVRTFFRGIEKIPAATTVCIGMDGEPVAGRFWQLPQQRTAQLVEGALPELGDELRRLLRDSVALRLRADFPVNVALSGGIDSSSIVAMAAAERGANLDTYTVRFAEPRWNEWPFAAAVVERFGVRSLVIDPPSTWVWGHLGQFVSDMEEPFHAPDLLPDHVIRHLLAARGFRVSLSGIGGDELFAGYEYYRWLHVLDLLRAGDYRCGVRELLFVSETDPASAAARLLADKWRLLRRRWPPPLGDGVASAALSARDRPGRADLPKALDARLRADLEWSLLPYWLRAGDKSSMAVPIELRYPLLDHRLMEFAARLPTSCLVRDGWLKWILRKAMDGVLPSAVVWRRAKMGFPFPIVEWLTAARDELRLVFADMENPFLSFEFWNARLAEAIRRDPALVWRALSFELWHRKFVRNIPVLPAPLADRAAGATGLAHFQVGRSRPSMVSSCAMSSR